MSYARLFTSGKFQAIDNDGNVVALGKLYITDTAGNPATTYSDAEMTTANSYPIVLSASGKADVYIPKGLYNIRLTDANDVEIWTITNYYQPTANILEELADDTSPQLGGDLDTNGYKIGKITQEYDIQNESKFMEVNDFVYNYGIVNGFDGSSSVLDFTIGSGTAYIYNKRVYKSSSYTLTLPASKDNYIDLDKDGTYHLSSVNNGDPEPSVYAYSIRLYKVITDATGIITTEDRRDNVGIKIPNQTNPHFIQDDGSNLNIVRYYNKPLFLKRNDGSSYSNDLCISNNGIITLFNQPYVFAKQITSQTLATGIYTQIIYDSEVVDRDGGYDPVLGRYTATEDGIYLVRAVVEFYSLTSTNYVFAMQIYLNGTANIILDYQTLNNTGYPFLNGSCFIQLSAGDYIEIWAYQGSGVSLSTYTGPMYLQIFKVA